MAFDAWSLLILTGTLLFSASLVPQLVRTVRLGRAEDISATFVSLVIVASTCNLVYFLHITEWIAASGFVANIIVWSIVLKYRLRPRSND